MKVLIRDAHRGDLPLMMSWRSNPLLYLGFYSQQNPLTWEEHTDWFSHRNKDWRTFIVLVQVDTSLREVGVVTIGQLDSWSPEIGYYIGELSLWGKGVGKKAVELAMDWLRARDYKYVHTTVLKDNTRSIGLLKACGFKYACEARKGEERWERELYG